MNRHTEKLSPAEIFQKNLRRSVLKEAFFLFLAGAVFFVAALMSVTLWNNEANALRHQQMLEQVFVSLYEENETFLLDTETREMCRNILKGQESTFELASNFKKFSMSCDVENNIILSDTAGRMLYSSFDNDELTTYLSNYNAAICYNAREYSEGEIYNAVFWGEDRYGDYMFVEPIFDEDGIAGYLSLFLSGRDWNFFLSGENFEGIITDMRDNVLYCSRVDLLYGGNKFYGEDFRYWYHGKNRYWMLQKSLEQYGVVIYSLVYAPGTPAVWIGILALCVVGLFWYHVAMRMVKSMAEKNSKQIGKLVSEIRIIQSGDHAHRIKMDTEDEFMEVACRINAMLDNIRELNERNIELLKINNQIEISQLTAQLNPHFLYNTLDTIRNLVLYEKEKAETLIMQLTKILRYSINNTKKDVYLEEDMDYIKDYLEIQRCRFGERFTCQVEIEEVCGDSMIPKLLLQPIIENSIKYGYEKHMTLAVKIKVYLEEDILVLSVEDDGPGMEEGRLRELNETICQRFPGSNSHGLHNIARRLYLQYGGESSLVVENKRNQGMKVTIRVKQAM